MIGFNRRFDPSFKALRERVEAGEIGRLEQLVITSRDPSPPPPAYVASSGGLFRDMTIHDFDMARSLAGEIVEVHAVGATLIDPEIARLGDIDAAMVVMRAASGALIHINNSRRCAYGYDQRLEAFGEKAMLQVHNRHQTTRGELERRAHPREGPGAGLLHRPLCRGLHGRDRPLRRLRRAARKAAGRVRRWARGAAACRRGGGKPAQRQRRAARLMETIRLTAAQALIRYLGAQRTERGRAHGSPVRRMLGHLRPRQRRRHRRGAVSSARRPADLPRP